MTPGTGSTARTISAAAQSCFSRIHESLYEQGQCDQCSHVEWGIMNRPLRPMVEDGHRPAKNRGSGLRDVQPSRSSPDPKTRIYEPEQLKTNRSR